MKTCRSKYVRHGASLVELTIVVAVLLTLLGILLPAVQRVRAANYRVTCTNNLRQIGAALHNFHSQNGAFPSGFTYSPVSFEFSHMTWQMRILPFLDQEVLWLRVLDAYRISPTLANPPHRDVSTVIGTFICPTDGRVQTAVEVVPEEARAFTCYLGIQGRHQSSKDGCLYVNSTRKLTDIVDGSSNTLLIGERPPSADLKFGGWYADRGTTGDGSCAVVLGSETSPSGHITPTCGHGLGFRPGTLDEICDMYHFWSLHEGGCNFGFADGAVRFLPYSVGQLLSALVTVDGGEPEAGHVSSGQFR